jgi:Heterokaryon incompatibility protein (HET)
MPGIQPPQ